MRGWHILGSLVRRYSLWRGCWSLWPGFLGEEVYSQGEKRCLPKGRGLSPSTRRTTVHQDSVVRRVVQPGTHPGRLGGKGVHLLYTPWEAWWERVYHPIYTLGYTAGCTSPHPGIYSRVHLSPGYIPPWCTLHTRVYTTMVHLPTP